MEKREYDIINELGPKNWLDVIAGEAVVWGHDHHKPQLVILGTQLAGILREIRFDDDRFCQVEALGRRLERMLAESKKEVGRTVYLEQLFAGKESARSSHDWEYDLMRENGIYQIKMYLPVYYGTTMLDEPVKVAAERGVRGFFDDPSFASYRTEEVEVIYEGQMVKHIKYYDEKGRMVRMTTDFTHEGSQARGWIERYYFVSYSAAMLAWEEVKKAFTLDQKR